MVPNQNPEPALSTKIQQIVPSDLLAKMKAQGMPIHEGTNPPNIEGIYISDPHILASTFTGDSRSVGHKFASETLRFSNQNSKDLSVAIDVKSNNSISAGIGGFLSGSGNKFTIFSEINVSYLTATAKTISVISGEITSDGIKDFYTTNVIKEKNDPDNLTIAVGAMRVIKDGDGLAYRTSSFRIGVEKEESSLFGGESSFKR